MNDILNDVYQYHGVQSQYTQYTSIHTTTTNTTGQLSEVVHQDQPREGLMFKKHISLI